MAPEPGASAGAVVGTDAEGKDAGALRTIGEVSALLGLRQHVLRYWEDQFSQLQPLKRSGGRRYYRPEDIAMVETIDRLVHREGFTLKGAKLALAGGKADAGIRSAAVGDVAGDAGSMANNFALRARLIALRTTLASALHQA